MGSFFSAVLVFFCKFLFVGAFSAAGIALGIKLRKNKNKKLENQQEAQ